VVGNTDVGYSNITNSRMGIDCEKKVKQVTMDMSGAFNMLSEIVVRRHTAQTSIDWAPIRTQTIEVPAQNNITLD